MSMISSLRSINLLLLCVALTACSAAVPEEASRYFFPPYPVEPKIEYVKSYFSTYDLKPAETSFVTKYILGEERPQSVFVAPVDVASDSRGRVFVADMGLRQVLVLDTQGFELRTLKRSDGSAQFPSPYGLAIDDSGRIYVSDVIARSISVFDSNEKFLFTVTHPDLVRPTGLAADTENDRLYVVDTPSHKIAIFDLKGNLVKFIGERGDAAGQFNYPTDVDVDSQGNLYVMDSMNARIEVFDRQGQYLRHFGERGTAEGSFSIAKNLAVFEGGQIYVTDALEHKLIIFSLEGELLLRIGSKAPARGGIAPGGFYMPRGLDVDKNGAVWVVDSLNKMVHNFQYLTPEYLREHPIVRQ